MKGKEPVLDQVSLRKERKKIISNLVLFLAATFVILLALGTAAWFASNREVKGNNMSVSVQDGGFELRVVGDNIGARIVNTAEQSKTIYDFAPEDDYVSTLTDGEYPVTYEQVDGHHTDGANPQIIWRLNSSEKPMNPGSEGVLVFYVVPKETGTLTVDFHLRLEGYQADQTKVAGGNYRIGENGLTAITETSDPLVVAAENYLSGHILFFDGRKETEVDAMGKQLYSYTGLCEWDSTEKAFHFNRTFTVAEGDVNVPQEVKLFWTWANTFGQMVFGSTENNGHNPVAYDEEEGLVTRVAIREYLLENTQMVFRGLTDEEVKARMATAHVEEETTTYTFDAEKVKDDSTENFDDLSLGYNKADQLIGTKIDYVLLRLSAIQQ